MDATASQTAADSQPPAAQGSPRIWGPVATVLWGVLIAFVTLVTHVSSLVLYLTVVRGVSDRFTAEAVVNEVRFDRTFSSFFHFATLLVTVPLIIGIVKLKRGSKVNDYLGFKWPPLKEALRWSLITLSYCVLFQTISLIWEPPLSEYMVKAYYGSAFPRWLSWLATIVAVPIYEEICYRGFLLKGLAASRLRWSGATLLTAALWAGVHQQYNWFWMLYVFGGGVILGVAQTKTNSTLLTVWLHILGNGLAAAQTVFVQLQE